MDIYVRSLLNGWLIFSPKKSKFFFTMLLLLSPLNSNSIDIVVTQSHTAYSSIDSISYGHHKVYYL